MLILIVAAMLINLVSPLFLQIKYKVTSIVISVVTTIFFIVPFILGIVFDGFNANSKMFTYVFLSSIFSPLLLVLSGINIVMFLRKLGFF